MPLTPSTLISARVNHLPSRSPRSSPPTSPGPRRQRKLYFPPGGHTHDRHAIPPDRLHISLSDPVLVAAEEKLSTLDQNQSKPSTNSDTASPGSAVSRLSKAGTPSQRSGGDSDGDLVPGAVDPVTMACTQRMSLGYFLETGFCGSMALDRSLLDTPDDSCDIVEVMSIELSLDDAASETSRHLAPLASDTFKEELYIRGYLKRPASRPTNAVPGRSIVSMTRKMFPKVLGRRQGWKIAESLRAEKDATKTSFGPNAQLSENHNCTVASVTHRASHMDSLESPGTDTTTTTSESFDLHEFSYITAFTTPPSSPSIVLDVETFKAGVCLGDTGRKHAV